MKRVLCQCLYISAVTFIEECHPVLDCKLICRLQHTFYCRCEQAISHGKLFPPGTNVFYWILSLNTFPSRS